MMEDSQLMLDRVDCEYCNRRSDVGEGCDCEGARTAHWEEWTDKWSATAGLLKMLRAVEEQPGIEIACYLIEEMDSAAVEEYKGSIVKALVDGGF